MTKYQNIDFDCRFTVIIRKLGGVSPFLLSPYSNQSF